MLQGMYAPSNNAAGLFLAGVLFSVAMQCDAWSGQALNVGRARLYASSISHCKIPSRNRASSITRIAMEWSPEEKARRAELARQREEKIIRERAERQRRLEDYDQAIAKQRSSTPTNFEPAGEFVMPEGNYGEKAQGLFGWANNNPSSKNAIYDLEFINSKAGGGNVGEHPRGDHESERRHRSSLLACAGEMMTELRGKGRTEEGKEIQLPGATKDGRQNAVPTVQKQPPPERARVRKSTVPKKRAFE